MKSSQLKTQNSTLKIVKDIKHNEKGQREAIWYGNGTKTSYEYHKKNYRVLRIYTVNLSTNDMVQDLRYTYDAVGNITTVQDEAQQTVFFNNTMIQPRQEYTYDALYRLVEAKGREKIGIATQGEDRWDDMPWMGEWMPNADPNQLQNYTQTYTYDEAGNMLQLQHQAPNGGYTRDYTIHSTNNQLLSTHIGSDTYSHSYDVLGNMLTMAHLNAMDYNLENSLAHIQRGTEEAFYQYRAGQRSRKIVQKQGGITEERIYLGNYEIFRSFVASSLTLERKTVHVSDDAGRIGMYEYRTQGNDNSPQELMRYIYSNHLQSSMLELDDQGQIISYEEYHPFGTTSYQATNASINAVAKRYRYTGKERDEESGLYYHGARYYISWLARWSQCDPIGIGDGLNVYAYVSNNPVMLNDPSGMSGSGGTEEERPKNKNEKKQSQEETKHSLPNVTITGQRQDFDWEQILNRVLNALKDTSIDVLTVIAGFSNAWISNQALGIGRQDPREFQGNQKAFLLGQVIGDLFSMIQGGAEIFGGFGGAQALAVALDSTGFGAVAGVILHAGGAELGLHGIAVAGTATYQMGRTLSMMSSVSGGGGGGYNNNEEEDTNSEEQSKQKEVKATSKSVSDAEKNLESGKTEVYVKSKEEAQEVFLRNFQSDGFKNASDMSPTEAKKFFKGENFYHWDDKFGKDGFLLNHGSENPHREIPHLQIHPKKGSIIRIFWSK